jgi:hypothetical protein
MGEMADFALDDVAVFEGLVDDYVSGDMCMHEAYDHGILGVDGSEMPHVQDAYDRKSISYEDVERDLNHTILEFDHAEIRSRINAQARHLTRKYDPMSGVLNDVAIANLYKERPTCNVCEQEMSSRNGRYGLFYFCENACEGQGTVSDKYWQKVRRVC